MKRWSAVALERVGGWWTDFLFTQSAEDAASTVAEHIVPSERVLAIGNGVSTTRFDPGAVPASAVVRAALDVPAHVYLIGMIGRQVREKGIAEFLSAAMIVAQSHPHAYFLLIGERLSSDHATGVGAEVVLSEGGVGALD